MKLVKFLTPSGKSSIGLLDNGQVTRLALSEGHQYQSISDLLEADDPGAVVEFLVDHATAPWPLAEVTLLAPIDQQEVWAAGVTYRRSRTARMEESQSAATFYDKVYEAARPELFFKATPHRVVGPGEAVRIRQDARWNVPEPELALMLNSRLRLVGYTIGNDMSSRDIEGENPLYLPQAKVYDACCALGPAIVLADALPEAASAAISLTIRRGGATVYQGGTTVAQMARSFDELVAWLARDNTFPRGVFLLTGTGIVPADDFTLQPGDTIAIAIEGIGVLENHVVQG